jgi:hypothetical protein
LGYDGTEERANFAPMIIPMKAKIPTSSISAEFIIKADCC